MEEKEDEEIEMGSSEGDPISKEEEKNLPRKPSPEEYEASS